MWKSFCAEPIPPDRGKAAIGEAPANISRMSWFNSAERELLFFSFETISQSVPNSTIKKPRMTKAPSRMLVRVGQNVFWLSISMAHAGQDLSDQIYDRIHCGTEVRVHDAADGRAIRRLNGYHRNLFRELQTQLPSDRQDFGES